MDRVGVGCLDAVAVAIAADPDPRLLLLLLLLLLLFVSAVLAVVDCRDATRDGTTDAAALLLPAVDTMETLGDP